MPQAAADTSPSCPEMRAIHVSFTFVMIECGFDTGRVDGRVSSKASATRYGRGRLRATGKE